MNRLFSRLIYVCAVFLMFMPLVSCSGGSSGTAGGTGTLSLGLTDAPGDYLHVFVTIKEIQVNQAAEEEGDDSGWITLMNPEETIDLKTLENGAIFDFGLAELEAGQYNQMRLILGTEPDDLTEHTYANYLVIEGEEGEDSVEVELKVPSGLQTGIKIVKGFEIVAKETTALILDFDANKSVVQAGNSEQWLLKPTIKVLDTVNNSVSGTVDAGENNWLADVRVSAQLYTQPPSEPLPAGWDPKDEVTVVGSALSDILGDYFMYLPPNTYNIVAAIIGYVPQCQQVAATGYQDTPVNFTLGEEAETITISGNVSGLDDATDTALLSIRQHEFDCGGAANVTIEVASDYFTNGPYSITISAPAGATYDLVASAAGKITEVEADINLDTEVDIVFQPAP